VNELQEEDGMRQTCVSGNVRAKEIAALVSEVKSRKRRLEIKVARGCPDGCTSSAPCRKGYYENDCTTRLNDIIHGNKVRWEARDKQALLAQKLSAELRRHADDVDPAIGLDATNAGTDIAEAIREMRRNGGRINSRISVRAGVGAAALGEVIRKLRDRGKITSDALRLQAELVTQGKRAETFDRMFEEQVAGYVRAKCTPSLTPAHFNRP
jgi:hypothetical protein